MATKKNKIKKTDLSPPKTDIKDRIYKILRAATTAVPIIGGPATELSALFFQAPFEKRTKEWQAQVAEILHYLLEEKKIPIEELQNNETFIAITAQASQIALRNHREEKTEALRNAVLNSAITETVDDSLYTLFLHYIDIFTVWHIKILKVFQQPQIKNDLNSRYSSLRGSLDDVLFEALPELQGKRDRYNLIWKDLYARGLVTTDSLDTMMNPDGVDAKRTTDIGDEFLQFITDPREGEGNK